MDKVRNSKFQDAKASFKDAVLLGPPSVDFAPYSKIPHTKVRKDARQGTIDQDPEFIEFLESLTNPVAKPTPVDQRAGVGANGKEKVTTTPLIQFLKDKKANKGKATSVTTPKSTKQAKLASKDAPPSSGTGMDKTSPAKPAASSTTSPDKRSAQAIMVEKAARDAARVLNKQVAASDRPQPPTTAPSAAPASPQPAAPSPLAEKKRERGSASAAANILRRDLGIGGSPTGRGGRRGPPVGPSRPNALTVSQARSAASAKSEETKASDAPAATATDNPPSAEEKTSAPAPSTSTPQTTATPQPPTGPAATRASPRGPSASTQSSTPPAKPTPSITPSATQAFLKHANPSQGITEPVLEEAFAAFGPVKKVEIDKKKGSAYVDFQEPEGLQTAIKASPVKVAQGQVIVLERRLGPAAPVRGGRGGPMMMNNRGAMDSRGGHLSHRGGDMRGGMMGNNHRGGPPTGPMGSRDGSMRGRGGFVRGGSMHNRGSLRGAMPQSSRLNGAPATNTTTNNDDATTPEAGSSESAKQETAKTPAADPEAG